ncbi:MAG: hypothetical protein KatS3mg077_3069 [Candidatus Binatia bacterium]|nr:MAG: hypothetical protein KatS3mg077_3069 [Candidatus Binatia bacterium]
MLIWRGQSQGHCGSETPLLLLLHGFGGLPEKFEALARNLAAGGLTVVAVAFPLTNENAPGGHGTALRDVINQPADVRFVIDALLAGRDIPGHPLYCRFHPQRIAVLGHSLGAVTLMALLRKQCCVEGRIAAAIFVAAPVSSW